MALKISSERVSRGAHNPELYRTGGLATPTRFGSPEQRTRSFVRSHMLSRLPFSPVCELPILSLLGNPGISRGGRTRVGERCSAWLFDCFPPLTIFVVRTISCCS